MLRIRLQTWCIFQCRIWNGDRRDGPLCWPEGDEGPHNSGGIPPSPRQAPGSRSPSILGGDNQGGRTGRIQGFIGGLDRPGTPAMPREGAAAIPDTFEEEAAVPSTETGEGSPILSDLQTEDTSPAR